MMQKIILILLFCSVVTIANSKDNSTNKEQEILIKTLQEVRAFKKDKNREIQRLKAEIRLLKKRNRTIKDAKNREIKVLKKRIKLTKNKLSIQKIEIDKLKKSLKSSQNKLIAYQKSQKRLKKQLKDTKDTVKDLHVLLKKKRQIEMDEYALGRYYYNH